MERAKHIQRHDEAPWPRNDIKRNASVSERALAAAEATPAVAEQCQRTLFGTDLEAFADKIERTLDPLGNVRDDASPRLRSLRSSSPTPSAG